MSRPSFVRVSVREEFVDLAGNTHPDYASAFRESVRGLLAAKLVDEGCPHADAVSAALMQCFTVVPRLDR